MKLIGDQEVSEEISVSSYTGTLLIGSVPLLGLIYLLKWSKDPNVRKNKQNLCKAYIKIQLMMLLPIAVVIFGFGFVIGRFL